MGWIIMAYRKSYKRIDLLNGDTGFIYFIQCQDTGPVKIGYTKNVKRRRNELQTGNPYELKILLSIDGSELWEKDLHYHFRDLLIRNEWFLPGESLFEFIDDLRETENEMVIDELTGDKMTATQLKSFERYRECQK